KLVTLIACSAFSPSCNPGVESNVCDSAELGFIRKAVNSTAVGTRRQSISPSAMFFGRTAKNLGRDLALDIGCCEGLNKIVESGLHTKVTSNIRVSHSGREGVTFF